MLHTVCVYESVRVDEEGWEQLLRGGCGGWCACRRVPCAACAPAGCGGVQGAGYCESGRVWGCCGDVQLLYRCWTCYMAVCFVKSLWIPAQLVCFCLSVSVRWFHGCPPAPRHLRCVCGVGGGVGLGGAVGGGNVLLHAGVGCGVPAHVLWRLLVAASFDFCFALKHN